MSKALLIAATLFSSLSIAHRKHHAHHHGHGKLEVVAKEKDVMLELRIPTPNVFGFEHEAKNEEDKAIVETATKALNAEEAIVKAAGCQQKSSEIKMHDQGHGHFEAHAVVKLSCENPAEALEITLFQTLAELRKDSKFKGVEKLEELAFESHGGKSGQNSGKINAKNNIVKL